MTVPVFELPGTTSNMYFVHVNLMYSVENTKIQKCIKDLRLELSGHLNRLLKTPMPS